VKPVIKFPLIALAVIAMFLPVAGFAQIPEYYNWLSTAEGIQHSNLKSDLAGSGYILLDNDTALAYEDAAHHHVLLRK
jgi:hypothetical protein